MRTAIDWTLNREAFQQQIGRMIGDAALNHDVIPLPIEEGLTPLVTLLSQIDCTGSGCKALCCKPGARHADRVVSLMEPEYQRLRHHWNVTPVERPKGCYELPLPCPLLDDNDRCTIYDNRPLVCTFYPVDKAECDGIPVAALQASCPEGRRVATKVYLTAYDIKKKAKELGKPKGPIFRGRTP